MDSFNSYIKSLFLLLTLTLALSTSCKDDDVVIDQANLVGDAWIYDGADAGNDFANAFIDAFLEGREYVFNADKTYSSDALGFEYSGVWEYSSEVLTLDKGETNEEVWEILELSASTLQYKSTTIDEESGDESTVTYTFKR